MQHLNDLSDLSVEQFDALYHLTCDILQSPQDFQFAAQGKILASLFYEPSTRTNLSFSTAMMRLGGNVIGFSNPASSSAAKGECLKDTITMVSSYADLIVMRNPFEGAAKAAMQYATVPLINAGDGGHFHPTQTLTDMTTILKLRGSAEQMHIGLCGDLLYGRTVHSLIHFLARYSCVTFYLIAPPALSIPPYLKHFMQAHHLPFYEGSSLEEVLPTLDVLYMTRIQQERFPSMEAYQALKGVYVLDAQKLKHAKKELLILHPLPRVDEIAHDVDDDPRAVYFQQARYGMYARMALLLSMLKEPPQAPERLYHAHTHAHCSNPKCISQTETYLPHCVYEANGQAICGYCDKPMLC